MIASLTNNSRTPHGVLRESSLMAHDRKGREGRGGEWEGIRIETWSSFVTLRTRETATGDALREGWAL